MKVTVLNNQSLIDVAIQATGKAENMIWIAKANQIIPSEPLTAGMELIIPEDLEIDRDIVNHFKANGIIPATALSEELTNEAVELTCEEKLYECFKD